MHISNILLNRRAAKPALRFFTFFLPFLLHQIAYGQDWSYWEYKLKPDLKNGKYGAVEIATGKLVIPHKYRYAKEIFGNYMLVADTIDQNSPYHFKQLWGLVNEKGELVIEKKYHLILKSGSYFEAIKGPNIQLIDENFRVIYETVVKDMAPNVWGNQTFHIYTEYNRFISKKDMFIRPTEYTILDLKTRKIYAQKTGDFIWLVRKYTGEERKSARYLPFFELKNNGNYQNRYAHSQILDLNGKVLFDSIQTIEAKDNRITMQRNGINIVTDTAFKVIEALSYKYDDYRPLYGTNNRWYSVTRKGKNGVVDENGKFLFPLTDEGRFWYIGNNAFSLYSNKSHEVTKIFFTNGRVLDFGKNHYGWGAHNPNVKNSRFNWPVVLAGDYGKCGLMDSLGKFIVPQEYDLIAYNRDQLIYFKDGKSGYLDRQGKVLLTTTFDGISPRINGFTIGARIKRIYRLPFFRKPDYFDFNDEKPTDTVYTFLTSQGKPMGSYDKASFFQDSMAQVVKNRKKYLIDQQGKIITFRDRKKYWLNSHFHENVAVITNRKQNKFGLINRSGKIIAKPVYSYISTHDDYADAGYNLEFENEVGHLSIINFPAISGGKVSAYDLKLPEGERDTSIQNE